MRLQIAFLLFLSLFHLLCHGETPIRFVALEQYEERNKVMQIRKSLEEELFAHDARKKKITSIESRLVLVAREKKMDERLQEYLKLRRQAQGMLSEIKSSNERQLELASMIDGSMTSANAMPQVSAYMTEARSQLRSLGIGQKDEKKRIEQILFGVKMAIKNIPPPREYTSNNGIQMRLVRHGDIGFYISTEPLKTGDVNLNEAANLVRNLSQTEDAKYRLPEFRELKALGDIGQQLACAVWSSTKSTGKNIDDDMAMDRFGVNMFMVWDGSQQMGRGMSFAELPNARYPSLGCYAVTDMRVGWNKRFNDAIVNLGGVKEDDK